MIWLSLMYDLIFETLDPQKQLNLKPKVKQFKQMPFDICFREMKVTIPGRVHCLFGL